MIPLQQQQQEASPQKTKISWDKTIFLSRNYSLQVCRPAEKENADNIKFKWILLRCNEWLLVWLTLLDWTFLFWLLGLLGWLKRTKLTYVSHTRSFSISSSINLFNLMESRNGKPTTLWRRRLVSQTKYAKLAVGFPGILGRIRLRFQV